MTKLKLLVRDGSCTFLGVVSEFFMLSLTRKTQTINFKQEKIGLIFQKP